MASKLNEKGMMDDMTKATVHEKSDKAEAKAKLKRKAGCEEVSKSKKKVKFSVFPASDNNSCNVNQDGLVRGKRFSKEEDELIKTAVLDYIEAKQLGEEGIDMILTNTKSDSRLEGCWKEIGSVVHWRPYLSVYQRARKLFTRGESNWTPEDIEFIRESYKKYGPNWKKMATELGKYANHVRCAFQRYKFGDLKKGKWSQHEYETLFELVNKDLQMSVFVEKKSRHGMLRDNIRWETISEELGTRHNMDCCRKWYHQLTSPMVAEGEWADSDDYRLMAVLIDIDASSEDEVDWDNLLEHRSGDVCRKRWLQMASHLGEHGNKSFCEQVEALSKRYCPDSEDIREALDARPVVD